MQFSQPRAEKVRAPGNMSEIHSAVHGTIAVYTDTQLETDYIIENWKYIMMAASERAQEMLKDFRDENEPEPFDPGDTYTGPTFRESDD